MDGERLLADLDEITAKIEELKAQLAAMPGTAAAADRAHLQPSILALLKEDQLLLLQRLPQHKVRELTIHSRNSAAISKPSRLRVVYALFWSQRSWAWWLLMVFLLPLHFGQRIVASLGSSTN